MDTQSESSSGSPADAGGVIVRDDQSDFFPLLDAAQACRRAGGRLKIVDSGKLKISELEWLGEAGADLYTSDLARRGGGEFILLNEAAKKGRAVAAYFHYGPFESAAGEKSVSFASLKVMGRSGLHLYVSNGRQPREFSALGELADACLEGGSRLVFYHHGRLEPALESVVLQGAWIHVSGDSLQSEDDAAFVCDCVRAARSQDGNIVLHVEGPLSLSWLYDIFKAGAFVLFHTPPSDYRSPQRPFELRAEQQKLDFKKYFLHRAFML